ncbi:MAG TPA: RNA 2',3'-cyclic phosphodiesterase [Methanocorpusculum sp.]|nr:RNA 2',3'-cyclic phosphodiesterase [Methanocorpusculum sp.]
MVRTFIAVEPSAAVRNAIFSAGRMLRGVPGRLSFVSDNQMHITLKFLGDIPESSVPKVSSVLDTLPKGSYQLSAYGVSVFGTPPRIINVEVHDGGRSAELASVLEDKLSRIGFSAEKKKFSPHITIARVKKYSPELNAKLSAMKMFDFGFCRISAVLLKKSVLTHAGPIYSTLHRAEL